MSTGLGQDRGEVKDNGPGPAGHGHRDLEGLEEV